MRRITLLLFSALAALVLSGGAWAESPAGKTEMDGKFVITPGEVQWTDAPSLGPGAKISILEGSMKDAAPFTALIKLPPGFRIPVHTHPVTERVTVLSGTLRLGFGDKFDPERAAILPPGSVAIMSPGVSMFAFAENETVFQLHGTGPWGIDYLHPEENPVKQGR